MQLTVQQLLLLVDLRQARLQTAELVMLGNFAQDFAFQLTSNGAQH
jgi:hypothetical protein